MEKNLKVEIIVGIFVLVMFFMLGWVILTLGRSKGYVGKNFTLYAYFENIKGLSTGNNLYLYGKYVGEVEKIEFPETLEDERIKITMSIRLPYQRFIKKDATAKITSKGILGGRQISISPGRENIGVKDGDEIHGYISSDPIKAVETAGEVLIKTDKILESLNVMVNRYSDSGILDYILYIAKSAEKTTNAIEKQEGLLGTLIYDRKFKKDIIGAVHNLNRVTKNLEETTKEINIIVKDIKKQKESIAYQLLYAKTGKKIVNNIDNISLKLSKVTDEIVLGKGLLHDVVYEKSTAKNDLDESIKNIKETTVAIKEGKGSLGAIIMDPTIYEDLKGIFGKIKRNQILKSLIRFSIQREAK